MPIQPPSPRPEVPRSPAPSERRCANCGEPLAGPYCACCGQRDEPLRQPIQHILHEAFVEFFGVDGRLWNSLWLLLFRPGHLTKSYLDGHRVRHLRPLRLYLLASLLFFFLLSMIDPVGRLGFGREETPADTTLPAGQFRTILSERLNANAEHLARQVALMDSLTHAFHTDSLRTALAQRPDTQRATSSALKVLQANWHNKRRSMVRQRQRLEHEMRQTRWLLDQLATAPADSLLHPVDLERAAALRFGDPGHDAINAKLNLPDWLPQSEAVRQMRSARTGAEMRAALVAFARDVLRRLPSMMFLMLPLFALLLKLLYLRRGWYYSDHLVFALHTHAFAFLTFTLMVLLTWTGGETAWTSIANGLLLLGTPVYFFLAMRRVYEQGWIKTAAKAWLLGWTYLILLNVGLVLTLIVAAAI